MNDVLAYFITWTTYGSWLPGDERGWIKKKTWGVQVPDVERKQVAHKLMAERSVLLTSAQREIVNTAIVELCAAKQWQLHARNVRTNHVHVIVTADVLPEKLQAGLKAWCSRSLSDHANLKASGKNGRTRWWTEGGDIELIADEKHLMEATYYVMKLQ